MATVKRATEIPTIDVSLVTIQPQGEDLEYILDTASQISTEPEIEETDATKLVIKGVLKAQKLAVSTMTGTTITLTDNVFTPELVQILQGGEILYDTVDTNEIIGYRPPVAGSSDKGKVFTLNTYSAQYDASGQIVRYEKMSFPNCQGTPISLSMEDDVFRVSEYTISSAPKKDEYPWTVDYVDALPTEGASVDEQTVYRF